MNTAENVSVGKPKVAGGIWRAPIGTTLPTDATTALAAAFKSVGYVAQGGVTKKTEMTANSYRAWGGDVVAVYTTEKSDRFSFGLIEVLNEETYKITHGDSNVSGAIATGLTVKGNAKELDEYIWVIELLLRENAVKRIVIPKGKVTEIGDVVYQDSDVINYPITITAQAGSDGDSYKEYIAKAATT